MPTFTWYLADEVTLSPADEDLGDLLVGETAHFHFTVEALAPVPSGATAFIPGLLTDDADAAAICPTSDGIYANLFTTGPLLTHEFFDVFLKVVPTALQSLGAKTFQIEVSGDTTATPHYVDEVLADAPLVYYRFIGTTDAAVLADLGSKGYDLEADPGELY